MPSFSLRHGYSGHPKAISVREDAPETLRVVALETALTMGLTVDTVRALVCRILRKRPDAGNWSAGNVRNEVEYLVYNCEWFRVYDIIEEFQRTLYNHHTWNAGDFEAAINNCLIDEGIGWQLVNNQIVSRGDDAFQQSVSTAVQQLSQNGRPTASNHIQ